MSANKLLIVGVARSGTTWVATILSKCGDTFFFNEPDDERRFKRAAISKRLLTRYPTIAPGDSGAVGETTITEYEDLWRPLWATDAENILIKSVFVPFCLEWLKLAFAVSHVIWVKRDLRNVVRSWFEYSSQANPGVPKELLIRRLTWQACSHYAAYQRLEPFNFYSAVVDHADLVDDPGLFKRLADDVQLEMGHEAWEQLSDLNSAGVGGHYGLPDYDLDQHIRRTAEQAKAPADWDEVELLIINEELKRWNLI